MREQFVTSEAARATVFLLATGKTFYHKSAPAAYSIKSYSQHASFKS